MAEQVNDRESLILLDKSFDQLMEESLERLRATAISDTGPGGVARMLLASINQYLSEFYEVLKWQHTQAFLSKAKNEFLDSIGVMLNCHREPNEDDEDYRYRIHQQALTLEKANETSVRLAALSVDGVKDVVLQPFSYGAGSFSVYVVTDSPYPDRHILDSVEEAVNKVRSYGVKFSVFSPRIAPIEIKMRLIFHPSLNDFDRSIIRNEATQTIREYISGLKPGDTFSISYIKQTINDISEQIEDIEIYQFSVKGRPMIDVDQPSAWNERFIEAEIPNAIVVS